MRNSVLEAVPNFSEGRDRGLVEALAAVMRTEGADVLDWSLDADHHRSVITLVGSAETVEHAILAAALLARDRIDLRRHDGVHPRVGALDVVPIVPLVGADMDEARRVARRVGHVLAEDAGIPVYFYGEASDPPGRRLSVLRRGGFEALQAGWPENRPPDMLPPGWRHAGAHPSAGATCVGARRLLLAWNVFLEGLTLEQARRIASAIRERTGGFKGLRALAFHLPSRDALQISMNLEDLEATSPVDVVHRIEELAAGLGGRVTQTEVIGMLPDRLLADVTAERLRLDGLPLERLLSRRLVEHLATRSGGVRE
jgi:glutamate formiminotransferase / 5-formyltetrahydrofolate cyclo-ligase